MPVMRAGGAASWLAGPGATAGSAAQAGETKAAQAIMQSTPIFAGVSGDGAGMSQWPASIVIIACAGGAATASAGSRANEAITRASRAMRRSERAILPA
jgi:hypothetical protein